jgi:hypothetical protein
VASTYALDGFAVAVGGLLVASGVLGGTEWPLLLACLVASYALWGAGLRVSLDANWALLADTGISSNAFSKAAHDLAKARGATVRRQRLAASVGYLLTEVAKEVPYYATAGAATLISDSVSTRDALIFLVGTNIGAAVYEYALACGIRRLLRRRSRPTAAPRVTAAAASTQHEPPLACRGNGSQMSETTRSR